MCLLLLKTLVNGMEPKQNVVRLVSNPNQKTLITQKLIVGIRQRQKAYYIRDTKLVGFGIKVNPKGQAKFIVEARLAGSGRVKRVEVGVVGIMPLAQARSEARETLNDIHCGVEPAERQIKDGLSILSLSENYYRSNQRIKAANAESYIKDMKSFLTPFLNRHPSDLSPREYFDFFQKNVKARPTRTDRIHRQLKAVYNYALKKQLVNQNPTDIVTVQDRPVIKPKDRSLSLDLELPKFLRALMNDEISVLARDAIILILATGMRRTEALELMWSEIDFHRFVITKVDTKNKHQHMIPMSNLVRTMILSRRDSANSNSDYVFHSPYTDKPVGNIRKSLKRVLEIAGLDENVTLHDLRRTFTAIGQELGFESYQIKTLLNHVDSSVTHKHYEDKKHPKLIKTRRVFLNEIAGYLEKLATDHSNGLRSHLFNSYMYEEEKTDDSSVDYPYAFEKIRYEQQERRTLSHDEIKLMDPGAYSYRNEELERAYDWEW